MTHAVPDVIFIDPYHRGSHAAFAQSVVELCSTFGVNVSLWTTRGKHWKWRLQGAGAHFAQRATDAFPQGTPAPSAWFTTDMMDVARFRGMLPPHLRNIPVTQYFHENQLTFPWPEHDPDVTQRIDRTYGMTNILSAMAADFVFFNSEHHRSVFFAAAQSLMASMPDCRIDLTALRARARVLPIPLPLERHPNPAASLHRALGRPLRILWNHRNEWDKGPDRFVDVLDALSSRDMPFALILMGKGVNTNRKWSARWNAHQHRVLHCGEMNSLEGYVHWLQQADLLIHDPRQEFFGISVIEAMWHGVVPCVPPTGPYPEIVPSKFLSANAVQTAVQLSEHTAATWTKHRLQCHEAAARFSHTAQHHVWENVMTLRR